MPECRIEGCLTDFSETFVKLDRGGLLKANMCRACQGLERLYRYQLRKGVRPPTPFRYLTVQVTMESYGRNK